MTNLFPTWAPMLTPHYRTAVLLRRRMQRLKLREVLEAALPTTVNDLLFIGEDSAKVCPHRLPFPVSIKSFSIKNLSGVDRIDKRLAPHRMAYAVFCFGEIIHQNWVYFDALLPSQYKFDSRVPVLGDAFTECPYRGYGIFTYALTFILHDLKNRHINERAYALVSPENNASIRGLEKAGFQLFAHLKGTRYLGLFITNKSIEKVPESFDSRHTKSLQEAPVAS